MIERNRFLRCILLACILYLDFDSFEYLSLFNPRKLLNESRKLQCEETPDNT